MLGFDRGARSYGVSFDRVGGSFHIEGNVGVTPRSRLDFGALRRPRRIGMRSFIPSANGVVGLKLPNGSLVIIRLRTRQDRNVRIGTSAKGSTSVNDLTCPLGAVRTTTSVTRPKSAIVMRRNVCHREISPSQNKRSRRGPVIFVTTGKRGIRVGNSRMVGN